MAGELSCCPPTLPPCLCCAPVRLKVIKEYYLLGCTLSRFLLQWVCTDGLLRSLLNGVAPSVFPGKKCTFLNEAATRALSRRGVSAQRTRRWHQLVVIRACLVALAGCTSSVPLSCTLLTFYSKTQPRNR